MKLPKAYGPPIRTRIVEQKPGPLQVGQFQGGQSNPTYLLTTPGRRYVLRRKPPGPLLPSAHAVDREFRVISALGAGSDVPVPRALPRSSTRKPRRRSGRPSPCTRN